MREDKDFKELDTEEISNLTFYAVEPEFERSFFQHHF